MILHGQSGGQISVYEKKLSQQLEGIFPSTAQFYFLIVVFLRASSPSVFPLFHELVVLTILFPSFTSFHIPFHFSSSLILPELSYYSIDITLRSSQSPTSPVLGELSSSSSQALSIQVSTAGFNSNELKKSNEKGQHIDLMWSLQFC